MPPEDEPPKESDNKSTQSVETSTTSVLEDESSTLRAPFTNLFNNDLLIKETKSSPLLASTPPTISKSLINAHPFLLVADFILGILTWTNDDNYLNLSIISGLLTFIIYFHPIVTYFGHLLIVFSLVLYYYLIKKIQLEQVQNPTIDNIINLLTKVSVKFDLLLNPIISLSLTINDLKKLFLTGVFLSPIYIIITIFLIDPKKLLLISLFYLLTYHSFYSRITRRILWKSKSIRLLCFYLTGINFDKSIRTNNNINNSLIINKVKSSSSNKPIRFTYVIYENQRKWLGIGWTSNLFNYERAPWTDEFLNESNPPDEFKLPEYNENGEDLIWKWVDNNWKLDLTNDGSLILKNPKKNSTTKVDPSYDEGFIYYDNTWSKPSSEDSFGKFTRRRRWLRTAELINVSRVGDSSSLNNGNIYLNDTIVKTPVDAEVQAVSASGIQVGINDTAKRRKSIRFESQPTILEPINKQQDEESEEDEDEDEDEEDDNKEQTKEESTDFQSELD